MSRPVADWRTLLPTLWTVVQGDAPAWVSERTRTHAQRLLAALTADVEGAIETAGSAAAAEAVTAIDRNLISRWRRAKMLARPDDEVGIADAVVARAAASTPPDAPTSA